MVKTKGHGVTGWAEWLFRLRPLPLLFSVDKIDTDDYMAVGGKIPLHEYDKPFEIYTHYTDNFAAFSLPRAPGHYDILNICTKTPSVGITGLLLINLDVDEGICPPNARNIHWLKERPFALMPVPRQYAHS